MRTPCTTVATFLEVYSSPAVHCVPKRGCVQQPSLTAQRGAGTARPLRLPARPPALHPRPPPSIPSVPPAPSPAVNPAALRSSLLPAASARPGARGRGCWPCSGPFPAWPRRRQPLPSFLTAAQREVCEGCARSSIRDQQRLGGGRQGSLPHPGRGAGQCLGSPGGTVSSPAPCVGASVS